MTMSLGKICKLLNTMELVRSWRINIGNKKEYEKLGLTQMMGATVKWDTSTIVYLKGYARLIKVIHTGTTKETKLGYNAMLPPS